MARWVVILSILLAVIAPAKGGEWWGDTRPEMRACCDKNDCRALAPGEARWTPATGWLINRWPVPRDKVFVTGDPEGRPWGCFYYPGYKRPRCLFIGLPRG